MTTDGDGRPPPEGAPPETAAPETAAPQTAPILDQAFDAGSLYALRAAVAAHATQAGLAPGRADDLVIAVHELAANAVRHGAGHGRLRVWRSDQTLRCEITDDGQQQTQQTQQTQQEAQKAPEWRTEPGHGLSLVRQVADQTSLHSGHDGTLVAISFALAPPGPPYRLDRREKDGCTILTVTGPLDLASAPELGRAIADAINDSGKLILDLKDLTGWDSVGLAALITAQHQVSATPNARMILAGLPAHLEQHLRQAGLKDRFTLADSQTQAAKTIENNQRGLVRRGRYSRPCSSVVTVTSRRRSLSERPNVSTLNAGRIRCLVIALGRENSRRPSAPWIRPNPDSPTPPNGSAGTATKPSTEFTDVIPVRSDRAAFMAARRSREKTAEPSPYRPALAYDTASAMLTTDFTVSVGPNVSSCTAEEFSGTSTSTTGRT
jgi:anti-anti-sigma factor